MAENLQGSFAITILKNDNTLYLVKGSNPIYLIHFQSLGLYLYSSTEEIMFNALMKSNFNYKFNVIKLLEGDILSINSMGIIEIEHFKPKSDYLDYFDNQLSILLEYCSNIGIDERRIVIFYLMIILRLKKWNILLPLFYLGIQFFYVSIFSYLTKYLFYIIL